MVQTPIQLSFSDYRLDGKSYPTLPLKIDSTIRAAIRGYINGPSIFLAKNGSSLLLPENKNLDDLRELVWIKTLLSANLSKEDSQFKRCFNMAVEGEQKGMYLVIFMSYSYNWPFHRGLGYPIQRGWVEAAYQIINFILWNSDLGRTEYINGDINVMHTGDKYIVTDRANTPDVTMPAISDFITKQLRVFMRKHYGIKLPKTQNVTKRS
jgi:hypothetical protein